MPHSSSAANSWLTSTAHQQKSRSDCPSGPIASVILSGKDQAECHMLALLLRRDGKPTGLPEYDSVGQREAKEWLIKGKRPVPDERGVLSFPEKYDWSGWAERNDGIRRQRALRQAAKNSLRLTGIAVLFFSALLATGSFSKAPDVSILIIAFSVAAVGIARSSPFLAGLFALSAATFSESLFGDSVPLLAIRSAELVTLYLWSALFLMAKKGRAKIAAGLGSIASLLVWFSAVSTGFQGTQWQVLFGLSAIWWAHKVVGSQTWKSVEAKLVVIGLLPASVVLLVHPFWPLSDYGGTLSLLVNSWLSVAPIGCLLYRLFVTVQQPGEQLWKAPMSFLSSASDGYKKPAK